MRARTRVSLFLSMSLLVATLSGCTGSPGAPTAALRDDFAVDTPWWVLPFDRMRAPELANRFRALCPERTLVLVGDRDNGPADVAAQVIHRYFVPPACSGAELHRMLKGRN